MIDFTSLKILKDFIWSKLEKEGCSGGVMVLWLPAASIEALQLEVDTTLKFYREKSLPENQSMLSPAGRLILQGAELIDYAGWTILVVPTPDQGEQPRYLITNMEVMTNPKNVIR